MVIDGDKGKKYESYNLFGWMNRWEMVGNEEKWFRWFILFLTILVRNGDNKKIRMKNRNGEI